jgi:hypothetical protein
MSEGVPQHIEEIVRAAAAAPSGDNSQPWHFVYRKPDLLEFHYHPEKDHPLLNVNDSGTLISLGAAIENASLEAKAQGYNPEIAISIEKDNSCVATMQLISGGTLLEKETPLHKAIHFRHSNRKAYKTDSLIAKDHDAILSQKDVFPGVSLTLIEDREKMTLFARNLTTMEEIALSNKILHGHFFASIFWDNSRNTAGEPGLHGKTLELPPPAQGLFRILKYWPVAGILARIGFPQMVAETNAQQNASSAAFGAITGKALDSQTYITAGRLLERIWLQATADGLSFQIVTGILFLTRSIETGNTEGVFSENEQQTAKVATNSIHQLLNIGSDHPIITFRIGYGAPATARSARMKARVEVVQ